ncbi:hypothetical protein, partial [Rubrivivax gelatinosus]|uniref:hypothetical protein n=1 Tax=Rubrivivax gelatinosus TaxID=28068 RepID=UPI0012FE5B9C
MSEDDLERECRATAGSRVGRERRLEPPAPAWRPQPGVTRHVDVAAQGSQLGNRRSRVRPCQRDGFLVHHRIGETGLDQHVAEVVHVDERRERRRPALLGVERTQPLQRARTQRREHQETVDRQRPVPARHRGLRVGDAVQHHVRPDQLGAARREFGLGLDLRRTRAAPAPRRPPRRRR